MLNARRRPSGPAAFLRSELAAEGTGSAAGAFSDWFADQHREQQLAVRRVPLGELGEWRYLEDPLRLGHRSGKFFTIEGLRVATDAGPLATWDQPIIVQPEVGVLGILCRRIDGVLHFWMQAKVEPGNVNGVQLSPTVQATRSNFTRVHRGALPPYLEYFLDAGRGRVLVDQLQGEQGSRFLRKRNRNMVVEVDDPPPDSGRHWWLTLGQIRRLLRHDNLVNMDARSVLACIPLVAFDADGGSGSGGDAGGDGFAGQLRASLLGGGKPQHPTRAILRWITDLRARYRMDLERRPLDRLRGWRVTAEDVHHETGEHFSVIGVDVRTDHREVSGWQQPLLYHTGVGLNGFVLQRIDGALHFLVRACVYPGNHELFELGATVSRSNADLHFGTPGAPPFLDLFRDPPEEWVRYRAVQSEEGGRFYHYQNRYVVLEVPPETRIDVPETHLWMTLRQVQDLVRRGYFNIEGRNLLACLGLADDREAADPGTADPGTGARPERATPRAPRLERA